MGIETQKPTQRYNIEVFYEINGFYSIASLGEERRWGNFEETQLIENGQSIIALYKYTSPTGEVTREINITALAPDQGFGLNTCYVCFNQEGKLVKSGAVGTHYPRGDRGYYAEREKLRGMSLREDNLPNSIDFDLTWCNIEKLTKYGTKNLNAKKMRKLIIAK